jgi:putative transcriptional regulator
LLKGAIIMANPRSSASGSPVATGKGAVVARSKDPVTAPIESLEDALAHASGENTDAHVHVVETPDVRAIRRRLHMSQQAFAETYRIPLPTLKNWEQGRRHPDAPAAAYTDPPNP